MDAIASQISSVTIVYWTIYSGADHRKHQSSASLAFVWGIHRWPVNFPHKGPVTRKMFPFDDAIMHAAPVWENHHRKRRTAAERLLISLLCYVIPVSLFFRKMSFWPVHDNHSPSEIAVTATWTCFVSHADVRSVQSLHMVTSATKPPIRGLWWVSAQISMMSSTNGLFHSSFLVKDYNDY